MKRIFQFTLPGDLDIDMTYENRKLAYTFSYKGNNYGNAVSLKSRTIEDVVAASMVLFTNALETKNNLDK